MKGAAIYKFEKKKKYLIHGDARVKMGASVAAEPFIWLDIASAAPEIVQALRDTWSREHGVLPNPVSWDAQEKEFFSKTGLKSHRELYNKSKYVFASLDKGLIRFRPTNNLGSQGFALIKSQSIEVDENAEPDKIGSALNQAFELCG